MAWQGINKRRFPRADYPCKLVVLRSDLRRTFSTHTRNIGVTGICIVLPQELPNFCPVEILLYLKDGGPPVGCRGKVIWAIKKEEYFDTGIEFIDIETNDCLRIEIVVKECLRKKI